MSNSKKINQLKINQLSTEQESQFSEWRKKWLDIGLSTEPANRQQAEAAINECYRLADRTPPRKIVWCGSPFSQGLVRAIVCHPKFLESVAKSVWDHVKNSSSTNVTDSVRDTFSTSVRLVDTGHVREKLMDAVKRDVAASMKDSMMAGMDEKIKVSVTESVWDSVWDSVWKSVWDPLWAGIEKGLREGIKNNSKSSIDNEILSSLKNSTGTVIKNSIWDGTRDIAWISVRESISTQVRVGVWDTLWTPIRAAIWDNVATHICECVRASANDSVEASGYGQHDANWLAFYEYCREVTELVQQTEKLCGLLNVAKHAGWFLPHEHICWISERPRLLSLDDSGRLHAASGPALTYPDGWSIYAINGKRIYAINGSGA